MTTKIRRIGNSQGILLPGDILEHWGVDTGDQLSVFFDGNRLVLSPTEEGLAFEEAAARVFEEDRRVFEELLDR